MIYPRIPHDRPNSTAALLWYIWTFPVCVVGGGRLSSGLIRHNNCRPFRFGGCRHRMACQEGAPGCHPGIKKGPAKWLIPSEIWRGRRELVLRSRRPAGEEPAPSSVTDLHMPPMNTGFQQLRPARESSEYIRDIPFCVRNHFPRQPKRIPCSRRSFDMFTGFTILILTFDDIGIYFSV